MPFLLIQALQRTLPTRDLGSLSILTPLSRCQNASSNPTSSQQCCDSQLPARSSLSRKPTQRQRVYPGSESSLRDLPAKNTAITTGKVTLRHGRAKVADGPLFRKQS